MMYSSPIYCFGRACVQGSYWYRDLSGLTHVHISTCTLLLLLLLISECIFQVTKFVPICYSALSRLGSRSTYKCLMSLNSVLATLICDTAFVIRSIGNLSRCHRRMSNVVQSFPSYML